VIVLTVIDAASRLLATQLLTAPTVASVHIQATADEMSEVAVSEMDPIQRLLQLVETTPAVVWVTSTNGERLAIFGGSK